MLLSVETPRLGVCSPCCACQPSREPAVPPGHGRSRCTAGYFSKRRGGKVTECKRCDVDDRTAQTLLWGACLLGGIMGFFAVALYLANTPASTNVCAARAATATATA